MKHIAFLLLLTAPIVCSAQGLNVTTRFEVSKTIRFSKKWIVEFGQQFQASPEIDRLDAPYSGLFNEIYLFPGLEETEPDAGGGGAGLSDEALSIELDWRTSSRLRGEYRMLKWLRLASSANVLLRPRDTPRYGFRTDLSLIPISTKRLEAEQRAGLQMVMAHDDGQVEWSKDVLFSNNLDWVFKKRHALYANASANLELKRADTPEWDRLRIDAGIRYRFLKIHRFDLGYRFQQRLSGKRKGEQAHGLVVSYELGF